MPIDYGYGFQVDITPLLSQKTEEEWLDIIHSYITSLPSHRLRYSYNNLSKTVFISCGGVESNLEFFVIEDDKGNKIITFTDDGEIIRINKEECEGEGYLLQKAFKDLFNDLIKEKKEINLDWYFLNF